VTFQPAGDVVALVSNSARPPEDENHEMALLWATEKDRRWTQKSIKNPIKQHRSHLHFWELFNGFMDFTVVNG